MSENATLSCMSGYGTSYYSWQWKEIPAAWEPFYLWHSTSTKDWESLLDEEDEDGQEQGKE